MELLSFPRVRTFWPLQDDGEPWRPPLGKSIAAGVVLLVSAWVGYTAYARVTDLNAQPPPVPTYIPAFRTTLTTTVATNGTAQSGQSLSLSFDVGQTGGKIIEMPARLGDHVRAGQPLARIDDADLHRALDQAQASLDTAQARYAAAVKPPETPQVASAQQSLTSATAQVTNAQKNLNDLLAKPTPDDVFTASQAVLTAQNGLQNARDAITRAQNDARTADANVTTAQNNLTTAQGNISAAQADVNAAQAAATTAYSSLAYARSQVQNALGVCQPNSSITIPVLPVNNATTSSMLPLPYGFACLADTAASPTPTPSGGGGGGSQTSAALNALSQQISNYNAAVSQYNSAVSTITTKANALATAQNGTTTALSAVTAAQQAAATAKSTLSSGSLDRAVTIADSSLTDAKRKYDITMAGAAPADVNAAQQSLDTARAQLRTSQANYDALYKAPGAEVITPLVADIAQQQAAVATAQKNLDAATLTAPFDGTISQVNGTVGASVTGTTVVFILLNPQLLRIDANVDQSDVSKLVAGQSAAITFDALAGNTYRGTVTAIGLTPTVTNGVVTYPVSLGIDTSNLGAGVPVPAPGMTATIQVTTSRTANALVVPTQAVKTTGRTKTVSVKSASGADEQREVTTGVSSGSLIQIASGLNDGDEVLLPARTASSAQATAQGTARTGTTNGNGGFGGGGPGGPVTGSGAGTGASR